ncbi:Hypothetical protein PFR_JS17-2_1959 [Propionibacterium freudenreichii]|nr:Hypothetical protein PFR_JS17-1_1960 [Propionibacterium freudenreichii]SCQ81040.1 Hypothetical protein PFR_JS17-2_1959 [Propionibacterium freudenreichii]
MIGSHIYLTVRIDASMKGPSRRRGNTAMMAMTTLPSDASMKGPSRRRGNP